MTPMSYDDKIKWLRYYQDSLRRERELEREVDQMETLATRVTPRLSGMPGGGADGQSLPRAVEGIIRAKQKLEAQVNVCKAIRAEVVAALEQITNPLDHEILRRRYVLGQTWEQIAVETFYSYKQVRRRHSRCVEALDLDGGKDNDVPG